MRELDAIEDRIWNCGERLIPGVTHNSAEVVRHKSSYRFFRAVIENDLLSGFLGKSSIQIVDIGCGTGHGSYMLADIPGAFVTAVDCSAESIAYARLHYDRDNISFVVEDASRFVSCMEEFDYVVSRHALEHIPNGLALGASCRFVARLMVNVPFQEPEGNPHHYVHYIREDNFAAYPNHELFYEDLDGVTFKEYPEGPAPNSIVCVSSTPALPKVAPRFSFPISAWRPEFLQGLWLAAFDRQDESDAVAEDFAKRAAELTSREADLVARESGFAVRETALASNEARCATDLATREATLVSREAVSARRETELATREATLASREGMSTHRETELATRKAALANLEAASVHRETELAARDATLTGLESVSAHRETELATREATLANLEVASVHRETELAARDATLASRAGGLACRETELANREAMVVHRETELAARETAFAGREQALSQLESAARQHAAQLLGRQAEVEGLIRNFESKFFVRAYRKIQQIF